MENNNNLLKIEDSVLAEVERMAAAKEAADGKYVATVKCARYAKINDKTKLVIEYDFNEFIFKPTFIVVEKEYAEIEKLVKLVKLGVNLRDLESFKGLEIEIIVSNGFTNIK